MIPPPLERGLLRGCVLGLFPVSERESLAPCGCSVRGYLTWDGGSEHRPPVPDHKAG